MTPYKNLCGDSNIIEFETGEDWIKVKFSKGQIFQYEVTGIGPTHLAEMKRLATLGEGLQGYINRNKDVKEGGYPIN